METSPNVMHVKSCDVVHYRLWGGQAYGKHARRVTKVKLAESRWKPWTAEGESPVCESYDSLRLYPSSTGYVKAGVNLGGPSPKAKYSSVTDSEKVVRMKGEKNRSERSEIVPETIYLQPVEALWLTWVSSRDDFRLPVMAGSKAVSPVWLCAYCTMIQRVIACSEVKWLSHGAVAKASINCAK